MAPASARARLPSRPVTISAWRPSLAETAIRTLSEAGPARVVLVAEGLAGYAGEPGGFLPWQAVERVGERQEAGADAAVALAAGEAAQLGRVAVGADRQGCGRGGISEKNAAETPQAPDRSVTNSSGRYHG